MKRRLLFALLFGAALMPACTAVLGMDRAELDEGLAGTAGRGGGSGAGGTGGTQSSALSECTKTTPECTDCLNRCGTYRSDCLNNRLCRKALDHYSVCLKGACTDDGHCLERLRGEASTPDALRLAPMAQTLVDCLSDECIATGDCVGTAIMAKCERYCACMAQNCSDQFRRWSGAAECLQACEGLDAFDRDCRGDHCEFGADDPIHCDHAAGVEGLNKCLAQKTKPPTLCLDRSDVKGPCADTPDCCDGLTCVNQECGR